MTTITKERLLTIKQWRETYGPGSNVVLPAEEAEELARIALVSLEAEPVAKIIAHYPLGVDVGKQKFVQAIRELPDFGGYLFAAPPAPIVPEEMYWQDAPVEGSSKAAAYATGWNDCREAMLQSGNFRENKDSSTNNFRKIPEASTSSPVTPDGWISCSERMPAQDDWILIYSKHGEYMAGQVQGEYVELSDGTLSWLGNALYWMPLPEPPQEAK
ncbi:DUF551 domain-containing protein [Escherichia coli]|uniref:DUF551 domain-containing protein n=2 Tax=Escherichia coli TaxID=562 RepID=UPI0007A61889|nr:DUF551 domain-containing protein [Escherichia coli]EMD2680829.1 DUF551 domain-containing protein [Shigella sonnei]EEC8554180.1 DUF551 domain-containing protein [Escherichia coli]EEQ2418482.1 DUF551 domain-containing protein [Escherichia coli]EEQ2526254.1 DUF551 domain-containing protein [Escherichia coli]EEQ2531413.1 DUF551 domain-containing protein [Escherichia coli]